MSKVILTSKEAMEMIGSYDFSRGVAFDTETFATTYPERWAHGGSYEEGNPTGFSLYNGVEAVYVDTCGWRDDEADTIYSLLGKYIKKGGLVICHNIVYDLAVLNKYGVSLLGIEWFDTMTAAHLIDEERKYKGGLGLKALAESDLGVLETQSWEDTRHDPEAFRQYGANDAIWTWQLAKKYSKQMILEDLDKLFKEIEMPFHRVLLQMEVEGVGVDSAKASEIADKSERVLVEYESEMYEMLGVPHDILEVGGVSSILLDDVEQEVNFNSGQQVADVMINTLGIELTETTPTGNYKTSKDVLQEIDHPFVEVLLKHKALRHMMSHFINKLEDLVESDGRMRPNWKNTGTVTGRLSCSSPNFQNLPNPFLDPVGVRECIVAPEGYSLVAIDFTSQEVRVMAKLSKDPAVIKMINRGLDPHLMNANAAFKLGIPDEFMDSNHPKYNDIKEQYDGYRKKGKVFSFAVPYGAGESHMAKTFNLTDAEAKELMDAYWQEFPQLKQAIDTAQDTATRQGYLATETGRRKRFKKNKWGRVDGRQLNAAFNFLIQSTSADMIRKATTNLYKYAILNKDMDIKVIMMVHDETVLQVKEEYAEQVLKDAIEIFSKCWDLEVVPVLADGGIGRTYAEAK